MDLIVGDYEEEITSQSLEELQKLTKWQKQNHGTWSTIIGGWAVWTYYQESFGSRDIDLILPSNMEQRMGIINSYFPNNKIETKNIDSFGEEKYYAKDITFKGGSDEIIFDLFYPEKLRSDPEKLGVRVDWSWVFSSCKEQPIGKECFILVPDPELLLPLKMVAALSRIEELRTKDSDRTKSKIWKDYYDVGILAKHVKFDNPQFEGHLTRIGLGENLRTRFLDGYTSRADSLDEAKTSLINVTDKIPIVKL